MIVLTLGGGLGNQMFQYAFARKVQKENGDREIKLNMYHLMESGIDTETIWHLNLPEDVHECTAEETTEYWNRQEKIQKFYKLLGKIMPPLAPKMMKYSSRRGFYKSYSVYTPEIYQRCSRPVKYIVGGYQTHRYWEDMQETIRSEMRVKGEPLETDRELLKRMQSCESVCVHVRRGDYVNDPVWKHLNICNETYYLDAMRRMKEQIPDAVFFIFSNNHEELEWIRENYHFEEFNCVYVDQRHPDYEELRMMYHCRHFIISNSTFSWWGQFLSDNPQKIVMAPAEWNREMPADGIYMDEWQIVKV